MENKTHFYEAMFLLDNQEVSQHGFNAVRDTVKQMLEKHGVEVNSLNLYGERKLAYKIGNRQRATYLSGWLSGSGKAINEAKAEFYLVGPVFRCMFLREDAIPANELALGIETIDDSAVVIPEEVEDVVVVDEPYEEPETEQVLTDKPAEGEEPKDGESEDQPKEEAKSDESTEAATTTEGE